MGFEPQTTSRNCDFELKNGSGFWGRGFIAGALFEPTTLLPKSLDNTVLLPLYPRCQGRNCDFELKNGSGFCLQGFISGASYEHTTYQIFMSGSAWPTIDKS